jgi:hypothetical protein
MVDSFAQALANYQAYYAWVDQTYGGTRTVSNLHPAAGSYTINGVWAETSFDFTICGANGICNFHPNYASIKAFAVCPPGTGLGAVSPARDKPLAA